MKTFFLEITLFSYSKNGSPYDNDLFLEIALPWNTKYWLPLTFLAPGSPFCRPQKANEQFWLIHYSSIYRLGSKNRGREKFFRGTRATEVETEKIFAITIFLVYRKNIQSFFIVSRIINLVIVGGLQKDLYFKSDPNFLNFCLNNVVIFKKISSRNTIWETLRYSYKNITEKFA